MLIALAALGIGSYGAFKPDPENLQDRMTLVSAFPVLAEKSIVPGAFPWYLGPLVDTFSISTHSDLSSAAVSINGTTNFVGVNQPSPTSVFHVAGTVASATDSFAAQSGVTIATTVAPTAAATQTASLYVAPAFSTTSGAIANAYGAYIKAFDAASTVANVGIRVDTPTSGATNYAAIFNGNVGLSTGYFYMGGTVAPSSFNLMAMQTVSTATTTDRWIALYIAPTHTHINSAYGLIAVRVEPTINMPAGTSTVTRAYGYFVQPAFTAAASTVPTLSVMRQIYVSTTTYTIGASANATITESSGVYITDPVTGSLGSGASLTIGTKYGILVGPLAATGCTVTTNIGILAVQPSGAANNYAIQVGGTAGVVSLNAANSNMIVWAAGGLAAPALTTRSAGTKLVLYPLIDSSNTDYALGVESSYLWMSVPSSTQGFKWYAGTTLVAALTSTGLGVGVIPSYPFHVQLAQTSGSGFVFHANIGSTITAGANSQTVIDFNVGVIHDLGAANYTSLGFRCLSVGTPVTAQANTVNTIAAYYLYYAGRITFTLNTGSTTTVSSYASFFVIATPVTTSGTGSLTITTKYGVQISAAPSTGHTTTNYYGVYIAASSTAASLTNVGIYVEATSGATNNYAAILMGTVGIGTSGPTAFVDVAGTVTPSGLNIMTIRTTSTATTTGQWSIVNMTPTHTFIDTSNGLVGVNYAPTLNTPAGTSSVVRSHGVVINPAFVTAASTTPTVTTIRHIYVSSGPTTFTVGANANATVTEATAVYIKDPMTGSLGSGASLTIPTKTGLYIESLGATGCTVTTNVALNINQPTGATNNYAIYVQGTSPVISLSGSTSNIIQWGAPGSAAPTVATQSVGTKIVLVPAIAAQALDYAIGIESATMWFSVADTTKKWKWYTATGSGGTVNTPMTLLGTGYLGINVSPSAQLHVGGTISATSGNLVSISTTSTSAASATLIGIDILNILTFVDTSFAYNGLVIEPTLNMPAATSSVSRVFGLVIQPIISAPATATPTLTFLRHIYVNGAGNVYTVGANSNATITEATAIRVRDPVAGSLGTGASLTIPSKYGVYIDVLSNTGCTVTTNTALFVAQPTGATTNYAVQIGGDSAVVSLGATTSNLVIWQAFGLVAPTVSTRSAGTKSVFYPALGAQSIDYALGVETGAMWFSAADTTKSFKWYVATGSGGTVNTPMTLAGTGALTVTGDVITSTAGKTLSVKQTGGNACVGSNALASGTVTISTTCAAGSAEVVLVTLNAHGSGTAGTRYKATTAAGSITITAVDTAGSTVTTDTSTLNWWLIRTP
jgi:hypothetical protein